MGVVEDFKIPAEKTVYFIAALIPGATALLIYQSASGTTFQWLFSIGYLGYKTKLGLLLFGAFVIGLTLTNLVRGLLDDLLPIFVELIARLPWSTKSSFEYETGPWRSVEWRNAIKMRLGSSAPQDLKFVTLEMMKQAQAIAESLPQEQQSLEQQRMLQERIASVLNDMEWSSVYSHYHSLVVRLNEQAKNDEVTVYIRDGLTYNCVAAALYVLASALVVPTVRHWWCLLPAAAWIFALVLFLVAGARRAWTNKWSSLHDQILYLSTRQI